MKLNLAFNRDCMEAMREFPDGYFDLKGDVGIMALRKIDLMHEQFGKSEHLCKDCYHFGRWLVGDRKTVRKCEVYGLTSSEASDWKASYQACGLFNQPYDGPDVIQQVRPERKKEEDEKPIDGQEVLWRR